MHLDLDGRLRGEMTRQPLRIKRVYQPPDSEDGVRVLVDRLWPRGLSRERAQIDLWLKEIAPSDALRRRFHGNPAGWLEINTDITSRKRAEDAARALSRRLLTLQEKERRRIANELHDSLGQYSAAIKMNLDGFPSLTLSNPPQLRRNPHRSWISV